MPRDPRYMTLAATSKLVISGISGRFRAAADRELRRTKAWAHPLSKEDKEATQPLLTLLRSSISGRFRGL